jgi:inorganic pyrophosphatase
MTGHPWHDVPLNGNLEDWFPVFVEINRGSRVKYELDKPTGLLKVDRILHGAVYYPSCYGFIPRTYCPDDDPLDVLVLCQEDLVPGVLVRARAIGVMRMRDEKGQDDKIIAVHIDDPSFVIAGLYTAVEEALEGAMTAHYVPRETRGIGYGVLGAVNGVGDLVSSVVVGVVWTAFSPIAAFALSAAMMLIGTVVLALNRDQQAPQ